jgi:hypothetical protein
VSVVVPVRGPLSAAALERLRRVVEDLMSEPEDVVLAVSGCDLSVVDAVARLRVVARRHARSLEVLGADAGLFEACGLDELI